MPFGAYTIRNRSRNVVYVPKLARGTKKFYKADHIADIGKMVLSNNCLFLITREMVSAAIGTWINMQRNPYFFRTVLRDNKRLALC